MTKEELEQLIAKNHLEHLREDEMRSIHLAHKLAEIGLEPMRQALKEVRKTAYQRMTEKEKLASVKSLISQTETQMQHFQVRYSELEAELKTLEEK